MNGMRSHRLRHARWLHARIPEHLEEALKREARRRRTPVSLLVRSVLEGALDLVEDVVEDGLALARRAREAERARRDAAADVYGWQELILNRATICARCDKELGAGATAYRGLRDRPGPAAFLCRSCIGRLRSPATESKEERS